jgi:hypothetical protein
MMTAQAAAGIGVDRDAFSDLTPDDFGEGARGTDGGGAGRGKKEENLPWSTRRHSAIPLIQ